MFKTDGFEGELRKSMEQNLLAKQAEEKSKQETTGKKKSKKKKKN